MRLLLALLLYLYCTCEHLIIVILIILYVLLFFPIFEISLLCCLRLCLLHCDTFFVDHGHGCEAEQFCFILPVGRS